jgi:hypothetical protein
MAFGLAGLLITLGVIIMIMSMYLTKSQTDIAVGNKAREQVKQIGGYSQDGTRASDSFSVAPMTVGGKLDNLLVTSVTTGGAMDSYYGLKKDDAIIAISRGGSMMGVRDVPMNDEELARAWVIEAYQSQQPIRVVRNGQELQLPLPAPARASAAPAPAGAGAAAPAPGAPGNDASSSDTGNPLSKQLDRITAPR